VGKIEAPARQGRITREHGDQQAGPGGGLQQGIGPLNPLARLPARAPQLVPPGLVVVSPLHPRQLMAPVAGSTFGNWPTGQPGDSVCGGIGRSGKVGHLMNAPPK
jgi:hypothetical protein